MPVCCSKLSSYTPRRSFRNSNRRLTSPGNLPSASGYDRFWPIELAWPKFTRPLLLAKQVQFSSALATLRPAVERLGAGDCDVRAAWAIDLLCQNAECAARSVKTV